MNDDANDLNAEDARECTAFLADAEAAVLAALNGLPVPDDRPRFARLLAITALFSLVTRLVESAIAEHPADQERCVLMMVKLDWAANRDRRRDADAMGATDGQIH